MQSAIHEGYEYQDYFSVSIILQLMLQRKDAEIIVDRKDFNGDKFDDLKVKLSNGITEFQIKYSDEESSHNLTKSDLSNGNGHDTALYDLFASWKTRKESKNNTEIKLCLAWGRPADDDPIAKFLKPIQEHEKYNLVTQIAIADLVKCYGFHLRKLDRERVINAINTVYPTGNLLLDAIFSELTIYKNFLLNHYDKHVPDYMEQEDIEFYLSEELYDLGKEKAQKEIDKYAKNSIYRDPIMGVIKSCGIDYMNLYKKLHTSKILNEKMQNFIGASSKIPEINTVYKSYVIQYALHAIIEKAFRDRKPELIPQNLLRLVPDYQGMYRLFKCRKIQPQNHLYDKANSCELFLPSNEDEYILIGAFEKKLHIDYKQASCIFAYQGIIGLDDKKQKKPFQECLAPRVETGEIYVIIENSVALINLIKTLDRELEDENYLLPENSVFKLFNVHIKFDFLHRRYIAVNQENDIIFIMKKWSSSYKGDSEYLGNVIPLYSGTELYIKREYIGMLEQQFGTLMMETCVEACTQTY